ARASRWPNASARRQPERWGPTVRDWLRDSRRWREGEHKMRKLLIGALVAVGLVLAQTTVRVGMLSGPSGAGRVMVLAPNGNVTFAAIGAGITLVDTGGGAWVLQSTTARIV